MTDDKVVSLHGSTKDFVKQQREMENSLQKRGGGGNSGGMDDRIAKLETGQAIILERFNLVDSRFDAVDARFEVVDKRLGMIDQRLDHMDGRLRSVETKVSVVEVKIDHLPSKGFIVISTLTGLAVVAALIGFTDQLQKFFSG